MNNKATHISNIRELTQHWLMDSVIQHQFCPYAKKPFENEIISFQVYSGNNIIELLEQLACCCITLDQTPINSLETTLLIVAGEDDFLSSFDDYLDALDAANAFLVNPQTMMRRFSNVFQEKHASIIPNEWEQHYQIASFHPKYCFADAMPNDRENLTNRSPFPIFHLLRNESIDKVRMDDNKADRIVSRNMNYLQSLTELEIEKLIQLSDCNKSNEIPMK